MTSFEIETASNRKMKHGMSNVESIIEAARALFLEKYPHIVKDSVATISYDECCGNTSFSDITFKAWNGESIVITDRRVYLNAADDICYILLEYKNDIEDICFCEHGDIQKKPYGQTHSAKMNDKAQESLKNDLICALGTMLPMSTVVNMSSAQVGESAEKIAQYLLSNGYVKEGC